MIQRARLAVALALGLCAAVLGACAAPAGSLTIASTAPNGAADRIPATLTSPEGRGPFPAVVIMHDCSGLGPSSSGAPGRWSRELVQRGYVTILPDSFTTRGHPNGVCTAASGPRVPPAQRTHDAYAALAYLRTLPNVDGRRVGIMGGSHGGTSTLATMVAPEGQAGFAAAVALYPSCSQRTGSARADVSGVYRPWAPVLILIGDADDWTPAEPCRALAEAAHAAGQPVSITVYPGAHHAFDSDRPVRFVEARINPNAPGGRGATTGGNPEAWADSIRQVVAFFGRYLAKGERS